jgi:phosphohistidine phosphatase
LRIFLVRHGDADADIPEGLGDESRPLTAKARQAVAQHLGQLGERMGSIDLILVSPLVRAVQTAQILSMVQKHEGPLRVHRCLLPDMPVGAIEKILLDHAGENLVLVGHQPSMGAMAAHLLGLQSFPKPVNPGSVIGVERVDPDPAETPADNPSPPPARLLFYAAPGQPLLETV